MNKKNIKRHNAMKILNVIFIVCVISAVVLNLLTLYYSANNVLQWNNAINGSTTLFLVSCILLVISKKIKAKIVEDFIEEYLENQNAELIKENGEEFLIKVEDKLFNVNVRFTKKGLFVLKQRASTAAEIEAYLFNGNTKELKTSKYNSVWQQITLNDNNDIEII